MPESPVLFIACDTSDMEQCRQWASLAQSQGQGVKLGLEFFNSHGPAGVQAIQDEHPRLSLFMDLKLHDIPNTVGAAIRSLCTRVTPAYITVHASGGAAMMQSARDNCPGATKVLGVTVLTSLDADTLTEVGQDSNHEGQVLRLAELAKTSGLDGVVCSAGELAILRHNLGNDFVCMVPGIRPASAAHDDQKRVSTPDAALRAGASHLVIGRPITQAASPQEALHTVLSACF
jgi:orotidine-5'-phosphate decarboxylase